VQEGLKNVRGNAMQGVVPYRIQERYGWPMEFTRQKSP
jgi:hypothetical protein